MSKTDRSIEKINYVKLLIFFAIFIVITIVLLFSLIIPNIKQYRSIKSDYSSALLHKERVEHVLLEREKELKVLQDKDAKIFSSFKHEFSKEEFIKFANQFFAKASLKEIKQEKKSEKFKVYELTLTSSLKTPVKFYQFLEGLNQYKNIVQADFPIELRAVNNVIKSSTKVKVYKLETLK